jgi:hypothetical protein
MKRRASGDAMNLDSLLYTLTNVVGVLVMVLMLTSLNVQKAVQRIREIDPSQLGISAAELARLEAQAEQQRQKRAALEQQADLAALAAAQQELTDNLQKLSLLKQHSQAAPLPALKLDALKKDVAAKSKQAADLGKQLTAAEEELAKLKRLLATTPELGPAPEAKLVSLPNPREAPPGAKPALVLCREGKVIPFDPNDLRDRAKKRANALLRPLKLRAGPGGMIDCDKLVRQFNDGPAIGDATARTRLGIVNFNLYLYYDFRSAGETAAQVSTPNSGFRRAVRSLDPTKYYISFLVWNDSFEAYVEARRVCDEIGLLAGWQPLADSYVYKAGLGIAVPCQGRPPPAKPAPGSKPAPRPSVPNDVVD